MSRSFPAEVTLDHAVRSLRKGVVALRMALEELTQGTEEWKRIDAARVHAEFAALKAANVLEQIAREN